MFNCFSWSKSKILHFFKIKYDQALFFNSFSEVGRLTTWSLTLSSSLPLFYLASGFHKIFICLWEPELNPLYFLVLLFFSNCVFSNFSCPTDQIIFTNAFHPLTRMVHSSLLRASNHVSSPKCKSFLYSSNKYPGQVCHENSPVSGTNFCLSHFSFYEVVAWIV